jgi:excisionase family DNA binding protein
MTRLARSLAVSISDTVRMLGVGRTSVYEMIKDGRLEAFKLGRRTLVRVASIRRLVDAQG